MNKNRQLKIKRRKKEEKRNLKRKSLGLDSKRQNIFITAYWADYQQMSRMILNLSKSDLPPLGTKQESEIDIWTATDY